MTAKKLNDNRACSCWETNRNLILLVQISIIIGISWTYLMGIWEKVWLLEPLTMIQSSVSSPQSLASTTSATTSSSLPITQKNKSIFETENEREDLFDEVNGLNVISNKRRINSFGTIFTNYSLYSEKVKDYVEASDAIYPRSWQDLNNQFFCPIKYSNTLSVNSESITQEAIVKDIFQRQFFDNNKQECFNPKRKFLIYDTNGKSGLTATINASWLKYFVRALWTNRTFILTGTFEWASEIEYCKNKLDQNSYLCYFLPISICNANDIINDKHPADYRGKLPTDCSVGDFKDLPYCDYRVMYIEGSGGGWYPLEADIEEWTMKTYFVNFESWRSVVFSFFLRLQSNMRKVVFDKVYQSIYQSFELNLSNKLMKNNSFINELNDFNPFETIGLPIRASDKCISHPKLVEKGYNIAGEWDCFKPMEYFKLLLAMKELEPSLNNVILTSEDSEYIDNITKLISEYNNDYENIESFRQWNLILNTGDHRPEMGYFTWMKDKNINENDNLKSFRNEIESNVIVGALSSVYLQMFSKYVIITRSSSFVDSIWLMAHHLNCEHIWFDDLLTIKLKNFIINFNLERQCLEARSYGLQNKRYPMGDRVVYFPHNLFEKLHNLKWNVDSFRQKYGMTLAESKFCQRFQRRAEEHDTGEDR